MNLKTLEFIGKKLRPVELALFVKWILRIKREKIVLPDNSSFFVDPISQFGLTLLKDNNYEVEMTEQIKYLLKEDDIFVDLGANEGYFSIVASKYVGAKGLVFSVEPQERLWSVVIKNMVINKCTNIKFLPYAIGSKPGEAIINLYSTLNSGASTLAGSFNFKVSFKGFRKNAYRSEKIIIKTLDEILITDKKIKLIKIDIEGFELEALNGATRLLEDGKLLNILIEIHPDSLRSMNQSEIMIEDRLYNYGYKKREIAKNLLLFSK